MTDAECVALLQWALPRLRLRWPGFRKVRRQVRRRLGRRLTALELASPADYRAYLAAHPDEWTWLDAACRISISRFYRDRRVWERLIGQVLPALAADARARAAPAVRAWSAGCASGEEPYTLALAWERALGAPLPLEVLATDADPAMVERARAGRYPPSSLRDLPPAWRDAFACADGVWILAPEVRARVGFAAADVREPPPPGPWDLVLCRNLVFTYFAEPLQREALGQLIAGLRPGGALVIGHGERLPAPAPELAPWGDLRGVFRRSAPERG